ncbi:peptide/nickel transport system substrate-binding protein [Hoeflea halophila]|uniref:Peptide/nickel transport system substrate-binding protein n=1 Tax=Hoeflea halophila TaxID=714899 RepID=A0A286IFD5_9HYPH|nr:extracellular solute-binding protein [Hoeflea halophila]SOE18820.1 peptide/nickel transport system substrate-binding protein [Hoeflea halophila]
MRQLLRTLAMLAAALLGGGIIAHAEPLHGIAMHGEPALPADFTHLPYVNPDAPKGGKVTYGVVGSFDSVRPFIVKSMRTTARGLADPVFGNLVYEPLMQRSQDEPFTLYGLLAETVEWDDERSFIQYNINPAARWSDGQPVTADDVIFTMELFKEKGRPPYSTRLNRVEKMEKLGPLSVRFTFNDSSNREFPLILSLTPVLPKHATDADNFDQSTLEPGIGSGPYLVSDVKPGERITYTRNPDYWARDLPIKRGIDNYDEIAVEYFLSETAQFEAFKKGVFDIYPDGSATNWTRGYDFPAVNSGEIVRKEYESKIPSGMYGFVFNTRKALFEDLRVRQALTLLFDFEWANRSLYDNTYTRTRSFWDGSELSSYGKPADEREREILAPFPEAVLPEIMDGTWTLLVTDGSGRDRKVQRAALTLLQEAGYRIENGRLLDANNRPFTFDLMTQNEGQEKLAIAFQRSLAALGIEMSIRTVDDAQYQQRSQTFDYDMIMKSFSSSLSPGAEQINRWGSASRDQQGSFNFSGAASPALDAAIDALLNARTAEDFRSAVRAYDRVLLSGHYVIPAFHLGKSWVAHRSRIAEPEGEAPLYGYYLPAWWDKTAAP